MQAVYPVLPSDVQAQNSTARSSSEAVIRDSLQGRGNPLPRLSTGTQLGKQMGINPR